MAKRRARDSGGVYRVKGSKYWWISYETPFGYRRESSGTEVKNDAKKLLDTKREAARNKTLRDPNQRVTVGDLIQLVVADYTKNGQDASTPERQWKKHLEPFFGGMLADDVSTDAVDMYIRQRKTQEAASGTINRELACLRRAFNLGFKAQPPKVARPLRVPHLKEPPARKGFVTEAQYRQMAAKAGDLWFRAILAIGFTYGFRLGEILDLRVGNLDFAARIIRLEAGETKNDEAREVAMTKEVRQLLELCCRAKSSDDFVFTRRGEPVQDFRALWHALCVSCGFGRFECRKCRVRLGSDLKCQGCGKLRVRKARYVGLVFHDLRRSAVLRMVEAGIPETTAMRISGHKTRSVFERYFVKRRADLYAAAEALEKPVATPAVVQQPEARLPVQ